MTGERLREVGAALIAGALREIDPARRVAETLSDLPELAEWVQGVGRGAVGAPERPGPADRGGRTVLVAFGKASVAMARGAVAVLGGQIDEGVVVVPRRPRTRGDLPGSLPGSRRDSRPDALPDSLLVIRAGHPLPDDGSLVAGRRISDLLNGLGAPDRVIVLVSGGGSALVTLPAGTLSLEDLRATTRLLLESGLPIEEVNDVRRVLDDLKGGGMARRAHPAAVLALVLSDIPSSDPEQGLRDVASGPLSSPGVSCRDVEIRLRRAGLFGRLPTAVQRHLQERRESGDTGSGDGLIQANLDAGATTPRLHRVGGGDAALCGMRAAALAAGFNVQVLHHNLRGEASAVGRGLARAGLAARDGVGGLSLPACLMAAGETTVRVVGEGVGGPNQETALAAARQLDGRSGVLVASFGTDGIDGPTEAAGGWVDGTSWARARDAGLDPEIALARNDSGTVLKALQNRILTGPTGTNVADVMFVLVT